jgi:hypothetical protein
MKWKQTRDIQKQRGDLKMPKYKITWKEGDTEYSFLHTPKKLTAKNPVDRLKSVYEQLRSYGWYTHIGKNPIIKIEELEK